MGLAARSDRAPLRRLGPCERATPAVAPPPAESRPRAAGRGGRGQLRLRGRAPRPRARPAPRSGARPALRLGRLRHPPGPVEGPPRPGLRGLERPEAGFARGEGPAPGAALRPGGRSEGVEESRRGAPGDRGEARGPARLLPGRRPPRPAHDDRTSFRPGAPWPDDRGVHVNAHGGGVLFRRPLLLVRRAQDRGRGRQLGAGRRPLLLVDGPLQLEGRGRRPARGEERPGPRPRRGQHRRAPEGDPQPADREVRDVVPPRAQGDRLRAARAAAWPWRTG